jgi:hypothetical protein
MRYLLKACRILSVLLAVLICMHVSITAAAANMADINILLPYPIPWVTEAARTVYMETGLKVRVTTMFSSEELLVMFGDEELLTLSYISELELNWSENLPQEIKTGKFDIIYMPSAYTNAFATDNFTNLYEPLQADPEFDIGTYHDGVLSTYMGDESMFFIPLVFDFSILAVNTEVAKELSVSIPPDVMNRAEYATICESAKERKEDILVAAGSGDQFVANSNWIPADFLVEALSCVNNGELDINDGFIQMIEDYADYYQQTEQTFPSISSLRDSIAAFNRDKALFIATAYSVIPSLNTEYEIYEFPYSQQKNIFHSVYGVALVDGGNTEKSWEFVKHLLSYSVQLDIGYQAGCPINNEARKTLLDGICLSNGTPITDMAECLDTQSYYRHSSSPYDDFGIKDYMHSLSKPMASYIQFKTAGGLSVEDYAYIMKKDLYEVFGRTYRNETLTILLVKVITAVLTFGLLLYASYTAYARRKRSGFEMRDKETGRLVLHIPGSRSRWGVVMPVVIAGLCILLSFFIVAIFWKTVLISSGILFACIAVLFGIRRYDIFEYERLIFIFSGLRFYRVDRMRIEEVRRTRYGWMLVVAGPVMIRLKEKNYPGLEKHIDSFRLE